MGSELLIHSVPLVFGLAYFIGFIYLWYINAKGK